MRDGVTHAEFRVDSFGRPALMEVAARTPGDGICLLYQLATGSPIEPDSLLGTPQSHGCLRMNQADAHFVWNWASVGTIVVVTDLG